MNKYLSFLLGIIFLASSGTAGKMVPDVYGNYVAFVLIIAGAGALTYAGYCVILNLESTRKKSQDGAQDCMKMLADKMIFESTNWGKSVEDMLKSISNRMEDDIEKYMEGQADTDKKREALWQRQFEQNEALCGELVVIQQKLREVSQNQKYESGFVEKFISETGIREEDIRNHLNIISEKIEEGKKNQKETAESLNICWRKQLEWMETVGENLSEIQKKSEEISREQIGQIEAVREELGQLRSIPQDVGMLCDELLTDLKVLCDKRENQMNQLYNNILKENKNIATRVRETTDEITDSLDNYSEEMSDCVKKMSDGYKEFEKMTESMIAQMTKMSEEDYEVLKGIFNG